MNPLDDPASADNPFSATHLRPGALAFQFPSGRTAASLVERLAENGWQGQVVGPHGSGKSALVAALIGALQQSGRQAVLVELHDGQRRLPADLGRTSELKSGTVLIVDGYEQLGSWSRRRLRRLCRRRKLALVVTAHTSVGFPDLFRTAPGLALAGRVVDELLGDRSIRVTPDEIRQRYDRGDLRELLFDLYDLYESRRSGGGASTDSTTLPPL